MNQIHLIFLMCVFAVQAKAQHSGSIFIDAPAVYKVEKTSFSRRVRYSDITTDGRFLFAKVTFKNSDKVEHLIDFSCFCMVSNDGIEYEVHEAATDERQLRYEEFFITPKTRLRFWKQEIKPHMETTGWLVFEVPKKGDYNIKFRGYLK